ncbi:HEAT repeat domain-containing protein [Sphingosinicella rhizophila]|uniref:HEAT repeat domain-containing protein n=1 Tax=Sphingosinicella rhizophila TaxID=3050082 RepID=A0ABU3QB97_9SPHN|nr:HEAT repeat domain-containing protein [Sphingosinicella sp. GR2756]MDT9600678.1 HEAT repeat domain-containing protein [Sphingosinicella sp. GR2756]
MTGLIIGRLIARSRSTTREAERKRLLPLLLGSEASDLWIDDPEPAGDLLTDLFLELIQLVRGGDKEAFVASATRLGVPQRLRRRLFSGSPRVRMTSAEALAEFPDEESVAALFGTLDDRNPDVRLSAALSLAAMDRAPAVGFLVEKLGLGTSESSLLMLDLFEEIARTRPDEIKALIAAPESPTAVKAAAIEALSASGDYSLVPLIADLTLETDPEAEELPRYLRVLGVFGHPAGGEAVRRSLQSPSWWVRAAAAEAAGRIGLGDTAHTLSTLLEDPDWWVRFRAGEALVRLGTPGKEMLGEVCRTGGPLARRAAKLTLAERGISI